MFVKRGNKPTHSAGNPQNAAGRSLILSWRFRFAMTINPLGSTPFVPQPQRSFRTPKRLTITVPHVLMEALIQRSSTEGRSLSNLAAYLLELSLNERPPMADRRAA